MNITEGLTFSIKTKTKDDVFGECIWLIEKIGLPNKPNAVQCKLIAGSGPAARAGYMVVDTLENIERQFAIGAARLVDASGYKQQHGNPAPSGLEFDD